MVNLLADFYRQNEWANLRLLDACRGLSDEQLDATVPGTYGSIRETLMHFGSDWDYIDALGGTYEGPRFDHRGPFVGFDVLEAAFRATADGLIERAEAVSRDGSYRVVDGEDSCDAEVVLVQALNHATDHRSQVCVVLSSLGIEPPGLDGWNWGHHTGRAT